jgi:hypothetical protein
MGQIEIRAQAHLVALQSRVKYSTCGVFGDSNRGAEQAKAQEVPPVCVIENKRKICTKETDAKSVLLIRSCSQRFCGVETAAYD